MGLYQIGNQDMDPCPCCFTPERKPYDRMKWHLDWVSTPEVRQQNQGNPPVGPAATSGPCCTDEYREGPYLH